MTDRELLEAAATAAGMTLNDRDGWVWCENVGHKKHFGLWKAYSKPTSINPNPRPIPMPWNPLTDDGDALRLAVKLRIHITSSVTDAWASTLLVTATEPMGKDPYAATRRAITRAAAEMGKE